MKRFLQIIGAAFVLLLVVIISNTLTFGSASTRSYDNVTVSLQREGLPERLSGAIKIKTVSEENDAAIDYEMFLKLHDYIDVEFPRIKQSLKKEVIGDYSLLYTWEGGDPSLQPVLLLSHMDVVPVIAGTEELWEHPPFSGDIADGYIWGRGSLDNKIGVFGILEAVEHLLLQGYQPKRSFYLAFGHDEERGGPQGARKIGELLKARGVKALYALDEGGFITSGDSFGLSKNIAMVNLSEKGFVSLQLTVTGTGGHSSMPPAETAAAIVSQAVVRVSANKFPTNTSVLKKTLEALAGEMSFLQKVLAANLGLLEPIIGRLAESQPMLNAFVRTTTAPTMLSGSPKDNVLPIKATAVINHRILPGETIRSTKAFVINVIDDERVMVEVINESTNPSPVSSTSSLGYRIVEKTIRQIAIEDLVIVPGMLPAGTDTKHYKEVADDAYRFIFAEINMSENRFHGTNERVQIDSYLDAIRFFIQLIRNSDDTEN